MSDDILNILLEEKEVVKVTDDMYTLTAYMEEAKTVIQTKLKEEGLITIAQVRYLWDEQEERKTDTGIYGQY